MIRRQQSAPDSRRVPEQAQVVEPVHCATPCVERTVSVDCMGKPPYKAELMHSHAISVPTWSFCNTTHVSLGFARNRVRFSRTLNSGLQGTRSRLSRASHREVTPTYRNDALENSKPVLACQVGERRIFWERISKVSRLFLQNGGWSLFEPGYNSTRSRANSTAYVLVPPRLQIGTRFASQT